ncbi:glycosyltransferase [Catenibacterium sp. GCM10023432]|uniref:glycosyltransferase n=1 Tax=Catenibacterium sp. GCM10023432 TaxID=3252638 RepID=UPI003607F5A8
MKKKIIIVSHAMFLGGVEKSLIGLLEAFDYSKYDVDLFLLRHEGELLDYIPKDVNLLPEVGPYTIYGRPMIDTIKEGYFSLTLRRLYAKIKSSRYVKKHKFTDTDVPIEYSYKYTYKELPFINSDVYYDLAISFIIPHYIVTHKVNAKKKIAWIHTDYGHIQSDIKSQLNMWKNYDYIASISNDVTINFLNIFPSLKDKIIEIPNVLPIKLINEQSVAFDVNKEMLDDGSIKLLSIGRYCEAKNFDNVPFICKKILELGLKVKWYIIGYGGDEERIKKSIKECNMEDYVILLGKKSNPYPYIKACDVYVQPSRYEGKCVSVIEAQSLHKPVIITNYPTAKSQLKDGYDGVIVPLENNECAHGIYNALTKKELLHTISENTYKSDYSNYDSVNDLICLID